MFKKIIKKEWHKDSVFLHHTGNMYGIGCSIFSEIAMNKIKKIKKRKTLKGFIILIPEIDWLERFKIKVPPDIKRLMQQFWPGNLTIILKNNNSCLNNISFNNKIAVRIPTSKSLRDFIKKIDLPVISTSINISGEEPLTDIKEILKSKNDWFDYFLKQDDLQNTISQPSTIIDINDDDLTCIREGSIPLSTIQYAYNKPMILFMCTANICRSPMAHYLAKDLVQSLNLSYRVASAGFLPGGREISENSMIVLEDHGIDASNHFSEQITDQLALDSWLILTMTRQHKEMLLNMDTKTSNKVYTLTEYTDNISGKVSIPSDIEDPYGLDLSFYRETFGIIKEKIDILIDSMK